MSILIKGMEMPTSCARCRCAKGCLAVNDRIARMDEHPWFPCDHRHEDCPLVPVPPHGRLIDADEFLKNVQLTRCFRGDYALLLNDVIEECAAVIPAEEGER